MKNYKLVVGLILGLAVVNFSGCSKKEEAVVTTAQVEEAETGKADEDYSINESIGLDKNDLRVVEYEDNGSGVKNPQSNFREKFAPVDTAEVNEDELWIPPSGMPDVVEQQKQIMGDDYELMMKYESSKSNLSEELIREMHKRGIDKDTDMDGLTDFDEIEIHHTNPNLISTSGDIYSDSYKVENGMDVNKKYDTEWIKIDDKVSVFPADEEGFNSRGYDLYDNYLDLSGSYNFRVAMYFSGDVQINTQDMGLNDPVVEVFNEYEYSHQEIEVKKLDNGILQFHVDKGYNVYLIHERGLDIDTALSME